MERISDSDLDKLVELKLNGESYAQIRKGLTGQGYTEEEVRSIIRKVDERVLRAELEQGVSEKAVSLYRAGLVVAIVGLLLTIGTNAGWILHHLPRWVVYGLFFVGILLMFYGRRMQNQQPGRGYQGPDRIRKKRPYK